MINLLTLLLTCLTILVSVSFNFLCTAHAAYLERLSIICRVSVALFSEICTKFDAVCLSDASQNLIRPDARLQIIERKNQHVYPVA
jgi:hypothetical protein